jgi:predicted RNase H-like HicB family nuclease
MIIRAVVHEAEEGGYWAEIPALPGCFTVGKTLEELRANLEEAISLHLDLDSLPELPKGSSMMEIAV